MRNQTKRAGSVGIRSLQSQWGRRIAFWGLLAVLVAMIAFKQSQEARRGNLPEVQSGPWGDMLVWDMQIHQPTEYEGFIKLSPQGPFWNFGQVGEERVKEIFTSSGCSAEESKTLMASQVPQKDGSLVIQPPEPILISLSSDVRSRLYLELAKNRGNTFQANPVLIDPTKLAIQLRTIAPNPAPIREMIQKLSYPRNGYTYFSDPEMIWRLMGGGDKEKETLFSFLTTMHAVMVYISVKPDSEIDMPILYWALPMPGVRVKDLYPLFESQKSLSKGGSIPITYLLPEPARNSLYTTALISQGGERSADCLSTALLFFSPEPDPRVSNPEFAFKFVREHYYEIARPSLAGDLVLLMNDQGILVHAAVHLAGDIVYSKNGMSTSQPWVLMHEKDMVGLFSALSPMRVYYMRWKDW